MGGVVFLFHQTYCSVKVSQIYLQKNKNKNWGHFEKINLPKQEFVTDVFETVA